eukprot:g3097.t1
MLFPPPCLCIFVSFPTISWIITAFHPRDYLALAIAVPNANVLRRRIADRCLSEGNKSREKDVTSVTPRVAQGNSSLSPKKFGDRRRVRSCERQKAKECVTSTDPTPTASRREVEGEDVVKQTEPMFIDAGVRRSAKSLHAKVAFSVISARGSLAEDAWNLGIA